MMENDDPTLHRCHRAGTCRSAVGRCARMGSNKRAKRLDAWLEARTTEQQRAVLHKMASEAVAYVEATASSPGARNKLEEAVHYLQVNLPAPIVESLKDKELRAAIEKALYDLKAAVVGTPSGGMR